jgi:HEAT repeat protein
MSTPVLLLRDVARLVLLLRADGAGAELRRAALRAAVRSARHVTLDLAVDERTLRLNGIAHLGAAAEEHALAAALRDARIARLTVRAGAGARDVAHLAGLVADAGTAGVAGAALVRQLDARRLWSVRLVAAPDGAAADGELPPALAGALTLVRAAAAHDGEAAARELDAAASLLAEDVAPDVHATASLLLRREGDAGARALIAHLAVAESIAARRRCFDALLDLGAGVAELVDALQHPQWYVVRNVAELLGALQVRDAEAPLAQLLAHPDVRVREAAAVALDRLATPMALDALRRVLSDGSPVVRRLAVRAIAAPGGAPGRGAATRLIAAFDREADPEVRLEAVAALGRVGTFDAVQRLLRLAGAREAHQGAAVRVGALHALALARGGAADATLRALVDDREPAVRETARRLLATLAA